MKKMIGVILFCYLCMCMTVNATQILPTDVNQPSHDSILIGVKGRYLTDTDLALKRMNEIRYEACKEGVINPATGKKLKKSDYVPIKWSSDLEYIARIRSAEGGVNLSHMRPNGKSTFSLVSPNGKQSWGEVLAWNFNETIVSGIEQWYDEKEHWVNQVAGSMTGHYEQMINPNNVYVGLAAFYSEETIFPNSVCGQFSHKEDLLEKKMDNLGTCLQTIEVKKSSLSNLSLSGKKELEVGDTFSLTLNAKTNYEGIRQSDTKVTVLKGMTWISSDENIIKVDAEGTGTAIGEGTVTIKAGISTDTKSGAKVSYSEPIQCKVMPKKSGYTVKLSKLKYIYNGRVQKPSVEVFDKNGNLVPDSNYTISYTKGCKKVGKYEVRITYLENSEVVDLVSFIILPNSTKFTKVTVSKKQLKLKWKKQKSELDGYQIQYATSKNFKKNEKKIRIKSKKTTSKKITKLKSKKTYYIRIRTYKKVKGTYYYSKWSKTRKSYVK